MKFFSLILFFLSEIRVISLLFLILSLKSFLTMIEFDYLNIILIVKSIESNAVVSLRFDHNINRLMSFHFEDDINSVLEYDDLRSRKYILYVSRPSKLELHLQFDLELKDVTQGFVFEIDKKKCDV